MTDAEIRAQAAKAAMECDADGHDVVEYMCGACAIVLGRRLLAIGRAEAFEEALHKSKYGPLESDGAYHKFLKARAAEERAKS